MPDKYQNAVDITTGIDDQYFNGRVYDNAGNQTWFNAERFTYYVPSFIQGRKYLDVNLNRTFDDEKKKDHRLNDWNINLFDDSWNLLDTHITGNDASNGTDVNKGQYRFEDLLPGTYYVCEELQSPGWVQMSPSVHGVTDERAQHDGRVGTILNAYDNDGTYCYTVELDSDGDKVRNVRFGNTNAGSIQGRKILDLDADGQLYDQNNNKNTRLDGWNIHLYDYTWDLVSSHTTGGSADGQFIIDGVMPGNYYVCEGQQPGWYQTYPYNGAAIEDNSGNVVNTGLGVANLSGNVGEGEFCWLIEVRIGRKQSWVRFGNNEFGAVTFTKNVIDELANDISDDTEFAIDLEGVSVETLSESTDAAYAQLKAGTYTFSEITPSNYNLIGCYIPEYELELDGEFTIQPGERFEIHCINELIQLPDVEISPVNSNILVDQDLLLSAIVLDPGTPSHSLAWQCFDSGLGVVGGSSTGTSRTVSFSSPGTYFCRVTITDGNGDIDSALATINVASAVPDLFPQVVLYGTSPASNSGGVISVTAGNNFNVVASLSQLGNPAYQYTFGGICSGATSTSSSSVFSNTLNLGAGVYSCTVSVTDVDGDTDLASVKIEVNAPGIVPQPEDDGDPEDIIATQGEVLSETDENENDAGSVLGITCDTSVPVRGYVVIDIDQNGSRGDGDEGAAGVKLKLYTLDNELIAEVETGANGMWEADVCPGTYSIEILADTLPLATELIGKDTQIINVEGNEVCRLPTKPEYGSDE